MRYLLMNKSRNKTAGFTLIEMLIIAPIVVLAIGGFIALMVSMIGEVLTTRDSNAMVYDIQDALGRVEQDARVSTQFLVTTGTLSSPQGQGNTTAAFTSTTALIMNEFATDKPISDPSRKLIYYKGQPEPCGSTESQNEVLHIKVIYYINTTTKTLWRRTIVPAYNTNPSNQVCDIPYQKNSCSPGYSAPICKTNDAEIMQNVISGNVKYFASSGSTVDLGVAGALNADAIEFTILGSKITAGHTISNSGNLRATKLNAD
jgi:competence protein ComGC